MKILFRVDSSTQIGTGHLMRCLTLAAEAKKREWDVCFVIRDASQKVLNFIKSYGFLVKPVTTTPKTQIEKKNDNNDRNWLAVGQETDAVETLEEVCKFKANWVVVDHYTLDATWHKLVMQECISMLVIDDLGNRKIHSDLLLDHNLSANVGKYADLVSANCKLLLGLKFALLRDDFRILRKRSLQRRTNTKVEKILITMGGVDIENYTLSVLRELSKNSFAKKCKFTVIVGNLYPHLDDLKDFVFSSKLKIRILSDVMNMAEILSNADLCIGAAGSSAWERCCLGLPSITLAIADNQIEIAQSLNDNNMALFSNLSDLQNDFEKFFHYSRKDLIQNMTASMLSACDGLGALRVLDNLEK